MRRRPLIWGAAAVAAGAAFTLFGWPRGGGEDPGQLIRVERGAIKSAVTTTGTVSPQNRLEIKPPIGGRVEAILVQEGDAVRLGQTLAWMSSTDRAALLDAARPLGEEAVAYWEDVYKPTPLIAPIDGEVIVRAVEPGQTVTQADAVIVLSNRLIVKAQVDETDIGRVRPGQAATIGLDAYPKVKVQAAVGAISYESRIVSNVTIYEVDIIPEEVPDIFRSGMSAMVEIIDQRKEGVLRLPREAVTRRDGEATVGVREGKETVQRAIAIGASDDRHLEIVSGLAEGDLVVPPRRTAARQAPTQATSPLVPSRGRRR
ncbi:MAG: efflux RND transporter periplasmic adaptor subunit [bacterium]|nr:efflux RND transporter periplasmic adaptor subunit [bacterium]